MARRTHALALAVLIALVAGPSAQQAQIGAQYRNDWLLDFQITQSNDCSSPASNDQITILFSNQEVSARTPEVVFGEDVLAEFSFSARDAVKGSVQFKRRVKDRAFLGARFIRVVNAGGDGWCSGTLTLSVDGSVQLSRVPMAPRKGNPVNGLQNWNRDNWGNKTYWEAQLPSLLRQEKK